MTNRPDKDRLFERIEKTIDRYRLISPGTTIVVGVSGGSDSLALLHLLHRIIGSDRLTAVYIDHQLRPEETPLEAARVRDFSASIGIKAVIRTADVHHLYHHSRHSLEEAARILRHRLLEQVRAETGADLIALGHTADDQVEEFFVRLCRGTGRAGLSGMVYRKDRLLRPLLKETKERLQRYLRSHGIDWCEDTSNRDSRFLRNRVRLQLLPLLEQQYNPSIRSTVYKTMDILGEEEDFLERETDRLFHKLFEYASKDEKDGQITMLSSQATALNALHPALLRRLLEKACWSIGCRPSFERIAAISHLLRRDHSDRELHLSDGVRVNLQSPLIIFSRPLPVGQKRGSAPPAREIDLSLPAPGTYTIPEIQKTLCLREETVPSPAHLLSPPEPGVLFVDRDRVEFPMQLRSFTPGDRFQPCNHPGLKKIGRYFNDKKIGARERPAWPVLVADDRIIALPGLTIAHHCRVTTTTRRVLSIRWCDLQA